MNNHISRRQDLGAGFTLVELLVAMAFFSFMLLIISVGVIQVARIYQSGVAARRTQSAARAVVEDVTREVRDARRLAVVTNDRLCLEGETTVDYQRTGDQQLLKRILRTPFCPAAVSGDQVLDSQALVDGDPANVQLRQFSLRAITSGSRDTTGSVEMTIVIATGAPDLLQGGQCIPGVSGSQFCSTTQLVSTATLRGSDNVTR